MTRSPEWHEIKARLFRFCGTHPTWARWQDPSGTWTCGRAKERDLPLARDTRIAAILHDPRLIPSRSMPEQHAYADVTALGWNRLLLGVFTYLDGPAHLDDLTNVAAVLLKLHASALELSDMGEHLSCETMDAFVEGTLAFDARDSATTHTGTCDFCTRQLAAYQMACVQISVPLPH